MDKKTKLDEKVINRLNELIEKGHKVFDTKFIRDWPGFDDGVTYELSHQWGLSCLNLLNKIFGSESDHYKKFDLLYGGFHNFRNIEQGMGIIKSAKDEYENDFLFETKRLIEAEVFDDFLEQAQYLYSSGYFQAAAVIAGSVLEDGLRKLCVRAGIILPSKPKLDTMNSELAKKGTYNKLIQKKITALADLRNKAAHGKWNDFSSSDVKDMLAQVKSFMETYFT